MDIRVLLDYVGQRLQLKFIYDETLVGNITLKPNQKVKLSDLYDTLETALTHKGLSMIRAGDWVRVMQASKARNFGPIYRPKDLPQAKVGEIMINEFIPQKFADASDIDSALSPFLSETATILPLPERKMLILVEYRSRIDQLRQIIELLDTPPKEIIMKIVELQNSKAVDIYGRLTTFVSVMNQPRQRITPVPTPAGPAGGTRITFTRVSVPAEAAPFIDVDERNNRLIMWGRPEILDELLELIALYDVKPKPFQEVRFYDLMYLSAADAWAAMQSLDIAGAGAGATTVTTRRARVTPAGPGMPPQPVPAATGEAGGRAAAPRAAVIETTNSLVISATVEEHATIESFLKEADQKREEQAKVRVYSLERRKPEEMADWLKAVFKAGGVDPRTKTPIPGVEGAPEIVPVPDINGIVVSASPSQHSDIKALVDYLDAYQPQVLLECTLIEVLDTGNLDLGLEFERFQPEGGTNRTFMSTDFGFAGRDAATGLKVFSSTPGAGATVAYLDDNMVNILLRALESKSNGRVLSKPRVLVNNNKPGTITSADQSPVISIDALNTSTTTRSFKQYVDAGTTLEITPHIGDKDFLKLEIKVEVSTFTDVSTQPDIPPPRAERTLTTEISIPDQRTIIIGGLSGKRQIKSIDQIPLLGDIPLLGELFKRRITTDETRTLYLFVKASVLRDRTFEDAFEETQNARDAMPDALQALDPTLTTEAVKKEIARLKALQQRRADDKRMREEEAANRPKAEDEWTGPRVRIPVLPAPAPEPAKPASPATGATSRNEKAPDSPDGSGAPVLVPQS